MLKHTDSHASAFSMLEVLGFNRLDNQTKLYFENVFYSLNVLPITDDILQRAIGIRQQRKMSAGDAIIAATALHHDFDLYTRNISDFDWIPNLKMFNPIISTQ